MIDPERKAFQNHLWRNSLKGFRCFCLHTDTPTHTHTHTQPHTHTTHHTHPNLRTHTHARLSDRACAHTPPPTHTHTHTHPHTHTHAYKQAVVLTMQSFSLRACALSDVYVCVHQGHAPALVSPV